MVLPWRQLHERHLATWRIGKGEIRALAILPTADQKAIIGTQCGLFLTDLAVPMSATRIEREDAIHSVAISGDGTRLASVDDEGLLILNRWPDGNAVWQQTLSPPTLTATSSLAFSPDGRLLAYCAQGTVILLDSQTGAIRDRLVRSSGVNSLAFSSDSQNLATVGNLRDVRLWSVSGTAIPPSIQSDHDDAGELLGHHDVYARCLTWSPDGKRLATASEDGIIKIWDVDKRECDFEIASHNSEIYCLAWSSDGQWVASGGEDGVAAVQHLKTGEVRRFAHVATVRAVAITSSGQLISASDDGSVKIWDLFAPPAVRVLRGHIGLVRAVAFSPDDRTLASAGNDETVRFWDVKLGRTLHTTGNLPGPVTCLAYSPDGKTLSVATATSIHQPAENAISGQVLLLDVASRQPRQVIEGHRPATWGTAFSPDGTQVATAGYTECIVKVWDAERGQFVSALNGLAERNWCVAVSPNGRYVASGSADSADDHRTIVVWHWPGGNRLDDFFDYPSWVWSVAFSPDSRLVAAGGNGGFVRLWDLETLQDGISIRGHDTAVRSMAFFPSSETLATSSDDRTIRLWDLATGEERLTLTGHTGSVWCLAISRDGSTIASSSRDGTVRLWRAATEDDVHRQSSAGAIVD
jgi:WD40 repeat protein